MSDEARKKRLTFARTLVQANPDLTRREVITKLQEKFGVALSGEYLDRAMQGKGPKRKSPTKQIRIVGASQKIEENLKSICELLRDHCPDVTMFTLTVNNAGDYEVDYEIVTKIRHTLGG